MDLFPSCELECENRTIIISLKEKLKYGTSQDNAMQIHKKKLQQRFQIPTGDRVTKRCLKVEVRKFAQRPMQSPSPTFNIFDFFAEYKGKRS